MNSKIAYGLYKLTRINEYYGSNLCLSMLATIMNPKIGILDLSALFISNLFITMFAFAINDIEDAEDDAKDPAKVNRNPISAKILSKPVSYFLTFLICIIPIFLLSQYGPFTLGLGITALVLGFLYSYKPVRLKSMPVLDLVSHGLFLGTLELLIVLTANGAVPSPMALLLTACIFFLSVSGDLYNEVRDYEVDRKTNIRNTAAYINVKYVKSVGKILHWLNTPPAVIIGAITLSLFENPIRSVLIAVSVFLGLIYVYMERKYKGQIVRKHAQDFMVIISLVLFLCYFYAK